MSAFNCENVFKLKSTKVDVTLKNKFKLHLQMIKDNINYEKELYENAEWEIESMLLKSLN